MITGEHYAEMDKLALSFLIDYNLYHFPLDVFKIAEEILHAELIKYSSLDPQQLEYIKSKEALKKGFTITERLANGDKRYKIFYNDEPNIYFQRFTIGHEIKHILLGEESFSNESEILADYFSKALQAPKCLVISFDIFTQEECIDMFSLGYESSGYWISGVQNRILKYGKDLFDYERNYMNLYNDFNKNKKD